MIWAFGVVLLFILLAALGIWMGCLEVREKNITPEQFRERSDQDRMDQLERWR